MSYEAAYHYTNIKCYIKILKCRYLATQGILVCVLTMQDTINARAMLKYQANKYDRCLMRINM